MIDSNDGWGGTRIVNTAAPHRDVLSYNNFNYIVYAAATSCTAWSTRYNAWLLRSLPGLFSLAAAATAVGFLVQKRLAKRSRFNHAVPRLHDSHISKNSLNARKYGTGLFFRYGGRPVAHRGRAVNRCAAS